MKTGFPKLLHTALMTIMTLLLAEAMSAQGPVVLRGNTQVPIPLQDDPIITMIPSRTLVPRPVMRKTYDVQVDGERFSATQIVLKFHEGSSVRFKDGRFLVDPAGAPRSDSARLARVGIQMDTVTRDLATANGILGREKELQIAGLFSGISDLNLLGFKTSGELQSGRELADLRLYYSLTLPKPDPKLVTQLIRELAGLGSAETVYAEPIPKGAVDIPPTTTLDLTPMQGYLRPASAGGIDVDFALLQPGGHGEGVRIIDVEGGWHLDHEDLPGNSAIFSGHGLNLGDMNHGTAVAGELWGVPNSFGVTGIAPSSGMGWSSVIGAQFPNFFYSPASAIANAAADLSPGDIILIEQHMPEFGVGIIIDPNNCNPDQAGYVPVEYYGAEFDAISMATAQGIIVVEAAGNGSMTLDGPGWGGQFDRTVKDSGAIMVGASNGNGNLAPACFTNNGTRVDVQGWGFHVATLGFGDAGKIAGSDERQWYTSSFNGTSSASPVVAGAAALIQGIRAASGLAKLSPKAMRTLLVSTGTPQAAGVLIGPQPDLLRALRATLPDRAGAGKIQMPQQATPGQALSGGVTFVNDGPFTWTSSTNSVACDWNASWSSSLVHMVTGTVNRGGLAQFTWTGSAPGTAGSYNLTCQMFDTMSPSSIGAAAAPLLVASGNTFDAKILSFSLPSTMDWGLNGNNAKPVTVKVKVQNTGTANWVAGANGQVFGLRASGSLLDGPDTSPIAATVPSGGVIEIDETFICDGKGLKSVTVRMVLGSSPFGTSVTSTTTCLGAAH